MKRRWPDSSQIPYPHTSGIGEVMTNYNHSIDAEVADRLKREEAYGTYHAFTFMAYVWWDRAASVWRCEVWTRHVPREVLSEYTLEAIMRAACERWGFE
jgi:hypothetical protein